MTTATTRDFDIEVSKRAPGYNVPQKMGRALWAPMWLMALGFFLAGTITGIVRANAIANGDFEQGNTGFTSYAAGTASGSISLESSRGAAEVLEGIRRFATALYLFAITLGLATITKVLRFQAIRLRALPEEPQQA